LANIKAVGLIEPLCICQEGENYYIVDGYVRYQVLLDLGVQMVPCLVLAGRDIYTPNRQVNHLTAKQEAKMLRKALEKLSEETIARAFGLSSLAQRLDTGMTKQLHPEVLRALEQGQITRIAARELTFVSDKRQLEILELMRESGDWSLAFVRTQVLRTPQHLRSEKQHRMSPWERGAENRQKLVRKLQEVEKHHDFYSATYRQYVGDLLRLVIYIRQIVTRPALRDYLKEKHPDTLKLFESVLEENEGKSAAV